MIWECSLSPDRLHLGAAESSRQSETLRCYPEDAPDAAIELK